MTRELINLLKKEGYGGFIPLLETVDGDHSEFLNTLNDRGHSLDVKDVSAIICLCLRDDSVITEITRLPHLSPSVKEWLIKVGLMMI